MRLCRFNDNRLGLVRGEEVRDVTAALEALPAHRYPLPRHDPLIANLVELSPGIAAAAERATPIPLAGLALLSPIANPGKIVAAPVNYKKHLEEARADAAIHHQKQVEEIQRIGLFLKASSSVVGPGEGIAVRHVDRRTDHEIELAVVMGRRADRVAKARAFDHVAGYCIGFDITVRGPEERSLRKSIDGYTVLGPWLVTADEVADPAGLDLELKVNGETRQRANTRDLIIPIPELIAFASSFYTLMPGDVLLTGTPEGVGPIQPGDLLDASISGIGAMQVSVRGA
ncbi:MAG TPA: fumarylacetoacetate hydrolase family protein [Xanthobacteraceae bacterium]|nr:fumarylacetoacetate hydrolase family protein [Xanthobacteraceae bacterium]